ncbi:MAG: lipopolysaccharide biosynthesis protein [Prevotellaceae bacterium]|nr:lipopolysaccharide biosynthesis protein [Prevotellaceae bacterium]
MQKGRGKDFLKNILIYGIGNIGSKLISFLLVPLYTYYVAPEAFGMYDVYVGLIYLFIPVLTFDFRDGTFRLLLGERSEERRKALITYTYRIIGRNVLVASAAYALLLILFPFDYALEAYGMLLVFSVYEVHTQILRGIDRNKDYVSAGILSTLLTGLFSLVFIVWLGWGVRGIFVSNMVARMVTLAWIEWRIPLFRTYLTRGLHDHETRRSLLRYSLPILPNVLCWWILSMSDRLFILHYLGSEANGIYAVANKLSLMLSTFSMIFYQAWQDTAIRQYDSADRNHFFSRIFNLYMLGLGTLLVVCAVGLKIVWRWIIDADYEASLYYVYPCLLTVFFYALSAFLDLGYQCSRQTRKMMPSILLATSINLLLNWVLVLHWGLPGIIVASVLSYLFLFVYRIFDTRQFFRIEWKAPAFLSLGIMATGSVVYYGVRNRIGLCLFLAVLLGTCWCFLPGEMKAMVRKTFRHEKE